MATQLQQLGHEAEEFSMRCMQRAGYEILARNFRCRQGELDLVARRGQLLVIAEVRLRCSQDFGGAAASITRAKQIRIVRATRYLMTRRPALAGLLVRFDALLLNAADGPIDWIENAFSA